MSTKDYDASIYTTFAEVAKYTADELEEIIPVLDTLYDDEQDCINPLNNKEVLEEGIVVRVEGLFECHPYKLKNFAFLEKETKDLDKGVIDLESAQSDTEEL